MLYGDNARHVPDNIHRTIEVELALSRECGKILSKSGRSARWSQAVDQEQPGTDLELADLAEVLSDRRPLLPMSAHRRRSCSGVGKECVTVDLFLRREESIDHT